MARVFISHSSKNNAAAIALRDWIMAGGWDEAPFLDLDPERGITAGERWDKALHEAADRCEVVLFVVTRAWVESEWCLKEFHIAQKLNKRVFGVLVEDIPVSDLPASLTAEWQVVNLAAGKDHELFRAVLPDLSREEHVLFSRSGLARLKAGLDKAGLDPRFFPWPPKDDPNRSPYPGLRPLEAEDAGIFFGREAPTVTALDRLRGLRDAAPPRLFVILGASGAGKSSFLRAGLLPRLARDSANFLPLPVIRPETAVVTGANGLVSCLERAFRAGGLAVNRTDIEIAAYAGAPALLPWLTRLAETAREPESPGLPSLVLSIDQGEELFLAEGAGEALDFLAILRDLLLAETPSFIVIVTIRSDSYERLQTAEVLEGLRQETFPLPPMPRGAYQTVIEGPALRLKGAKRSLRIEPSLTEALLTDIEQGAGKDALPLLAFTLEWLYREFGSDGDLRVEEYESLGGIKGSIRAAVDAALKAADSDPTIPKDPVERMALLRRALIPALAGIDPETGAPRRRVAAMSEIPAHARELVECLVEARLLATDGAPGGATLVEPAHEALLRQWNVLQDWLQEDSAALAAFEGLRRAARDWNAKERSDAWLGHHAGRLEDAEALRRREDFASFVTPLENIYLEACRRLENERRNREFAEARKLAEAQTTIAQRTRIGLVTASVLLLLALGAAWYGFDRAREAREQSRVARTEAAEAEKQKVAAERQTAAALLNESISQAALSNLALDRGQPDDAVRLALAAWPRDGDDKRPQMRRVIDVLASALRLDRERLRLAGHGGTVHFAAFSPDDTRVVTTSADKTARLWDARTGNLVVALVGHGDAVHSAGFSPDGRRLVTASADRTARVFDAETGEFVVELRGHGDAVRSAAFSPDGTRIVTASADTTARIWDARTGKVVTELRGHDAAVHSAEFSPDGTRIVTASWDKTTRIWDARKGTLLGELAERRQLLNSAAFSPDGTRIVTASADNAARIWDAKTGKLLVELRGHGDTVRSAAFSPDGARVVTASADDSARIWDATTGKLLVGLDGHRNDLGSAAFSPNGTRVVTASADKTARIWDATTGAAFIELKGYGDTVFGAAYSPDGTRIVTASSDNVARVWDAKGDKAPSELWGHGDAVVAAAYSPDGARIVTASSDKTARVWDARTSKVLTELKGHGDMVRSAAFSPDGTRIVTASTDNTARIWDARTGAVLGELKGHEDMVYSAAFSPDGAQVLSASADNTAGVWDARTGKLLAKLKGHDDIVYSAMYSPDGACIVTASADKTARIWNAQTGKPLVELKGHADTVYDAEYSPDGTRIVTASSDKTARVWDARTGKVLTELKGHREAVRSAAFSPDGARVVTGALDRTARIWDISALDNDDAVAVACARLGNNTGLKDVAKRYGLEELKPICGVHKPAPIDWAKLVD